MNGTEARTVAAPPQRPSRLPPAWPLTALLLLYPLWWALGFGVLIYLLVAAPMAWALARRRPIRIPPGFTLWLLFLAVVVISMAALEFDPPGTLPTSAWQRLPGTVLRLAEYASLTVLLLYVGNLSKKELPQSRLIRLLGWSFLITVVGGFVGVLWPHLAFDSPIEMLLPDRYAENSFVKTLVHPAVAQQHEVLGYPTPRPAAPWGYTNLWGANFALLAIWFAVAGWARSHDDTPRAVRWRRAAAVVVLAISVVPVVVSLNRGLWLCLGVAAALIAVRMAMRGQLLAIGALTVATVSLMVLLAASPLGHLVRDRIATGHSNDIRMYTTEKALDGIAYSPVIGFGTTRDSMGSDSSIAVGNSAGCDNCGNHTIGSNGQVWLELYAHGFLGVVLFLAFCCYPLWRYRRDNSVIGIAASTVLVLNLLASAYYNTLVTPLAFTFISYAIWWRENSTAAVTSR